MRVVASSVSNVFDAKMRADSYARPPATCSDVQCASGSCVKILPTHLDGAAALPGPHRSKGSSARFGPVDLDASESGIDSEWIYLRGASEAVATIEVGSNDNNGRSAERLQDLESCLGVRGLAREDHVRLPADQSQTRVERSRNCHALGSRETSNVCRRCNIAEPSHLNREIPRHRVC